MTRASFAFAIFVCAWALSASQSLAQQSVEWHPLGPGGGGTVLASGISPADPNRNLVTSDVGGVFLSTDKGVTWTPKNEFLATQTGGVFWYGSGIAVNFHPQDPNIVWVGTQKSIDGGLTFMKGTLAGGSAIALDPTDTNKVYIGTNYGTVATSPFASPNTYPFDGVAIGTCPVGSGDPAHPNGPGVVPVVKSVAVSRVTSSRILAATDCGLFASDDSGANWGLVPTVGLPANGGRFGTLVAATNLPGLLVATLASPIAEYVPGSTYKGGVYRSLDDGMTWVATNGSTDAVSNHNGEFDTPAPGDPNLAANWGGGTRVCGAGALNGVCSLRIDGNNQAQSDFIPVTAGQRYDINLMLKLTGAPGTVLVRVFFWTLNPFGGAVRPDSPPYGDPNAVYWANAQQITATQDWTAMENTVTIPQGATHATIAVQAGNGTGMTTWVDSVAFARSTALPKRVDYWRLAVDASGAFFTSPAEYDLSSAGDEFISGVWRTTDGGANWYKLNRFLFPGPVTNGGPAVFPNFSAPRANATAHSGAFNGYSLSVGPPGANQVIYWGSNFWLIKSTDGGANWTQSDSTTDASGNSFGAKNDVASHAVVLDSRRPNRLYYGDADNFLVVTQNLDSSLTLPNAKFHEQLPQGLLGANPLSGGDAATSVALDPANADHVFVGWGWWDLPIGDPAPAFANDPKNTTGVAEATYNGTSWSWSNQQKIGTTGVGMVRLALDATVSPRMLYAAKYSNGVYQRPADQALPWTDLTTNSWTPRPAVWKVNSIAKSPGSRRLFAGFGDPSATCLSNGPAGEVCAGPSPGIPSGDTGVWSMDPTVSTAWTKITSNPVTSLSCQGSDVSSLAYDPVLTLLPVGASTLYVGTHSALRSGRGGLYKGTCTGACAAPTDWSWCRVLPTGQSVDAQTRVNGVAQSSESPNVLYAVVSQNETLGDTITKAGLWGSRDAGLNWRYIADVPAGRTQNLWNVALAASPVPSTSRTLYAATFGTGLFQGKVTCSPPGAGNPDGDSDGVSDYCDNCRYVSNATQDDTNADGIGDACAPVAAYSFDAVTGSTLPDVSGNANNGTIHGATLTPGRFGNAMSFNGTSHNVQVASNSALQMTNAMTLEAWVKPSQSMTGTNWRTVIQKQHDLYFLSANSNTNQPAVGGTLVNNGCCLNAQGGATLPSGQWHFLAATFKGSTNTKFRLYLDGTQIATASQSGSLNLQTSTFPVWIGGDEYPNEFFPGLVDNVRIYKRVLTQPEIQEDMNRPLGP